MNSILHYAARTIFRTLEPIVRVRAPAARTLTTGKLPLTGQRIKARLQLVPLLVSHNKPCQHRCFMLASQLSRCHRGCCRKKLRKKRERSDYHNKEECGHCPREPVKFPLCKKRKNCFFARRRGPYKYRPKRPLHKCDLPRCREDFCPYVNPRALKERLEEERRLDREVRAQVKLEECVHRCIPRRRKKKKAKHVVRCYKGRKHRKSHR